MAMIVAVVLGAAALVLLCVDQDHRQLRLVRFPVDAGAEWPRSSANGRGDHQADRRSPGDSCCRNDLPVVPGDALTVPLHLAVHYATAVNAPTLRAHARFVVFAVDLAPVTNPAKLESMRRGTGAQFGARY